VRRRALCDVDTLARSRLCATVCRLLHSAPSTGPRARYGELVRQGLLSNGDAAQLAAVDALQSLYERLLSVPRTLWGTPAASLRGLYLHGSPGRGKTVLMDMFHGCLVASGIPAPREHSHRWMLSLHQRLHSLRGVRNSLAAAARETVSGARVLCLDELEISDVADASLLRQAYPALRACGTTLVFTSNCAPEALYRGGLNRDVLFAPFVADLRATCDVVSLDGGVDYRQLAGPPLPSLYACGDSAADMLGRTFAALAPPGVRPQATHVPVPGAARSVAVPAAAGQVCRFSFDELCSATLSAADYLALCDTFDAFVLDGVPAERSNDELRRFITLLDCLYDQNKLLALSSAQPLARLFETETRSMGQAHGADSDASSLGLRPTNAAAGSLSVSGDGGSSGRSTTMIGNVEWSATGRSGASLAHLSAGGFAAAAAPRAASRLAQMTSRAWVQAWAQRHAPPATWTLLLGSGDAQI